MSRLRIHTGICTLGNSSTTKCYLYYPLIISKKWNTEIVMKLIIINNKIG